MKVSLGICAQLACVWEATARKPGNVHRHRDFDDLRYIDFLQSAIAIGSVFDRTAQITVGELVLQAIQQTRRLVATNTNLGILLLLAPLAKAAAAGELRLTLPQVLDALTVQDSRLVYEAIQLAMPGGMGKVEEEDIASVPTKPLREIMKLAADRDMIARQYINGFADVFEVGVPELMAGLARYNGMEEAIIHCHLRLLSTYPDSLIARKFGVAEVQAISDRARALFTAGWEDDPNRAARVEMLDRWLSEQQPRRNPGTTADLVTASLFVCLCEGKIQLPLEYRW